MGITGDVAAIAVGGVAVASVVVRGGYNGNRSGCSSCSWREVIAAKLIHDRVVKSLDDKEQKQFLYTSPEKSDIGIIARLNLALRSRDTSRGAKMIAEKLVKDYYDINPEIFLQVTDELVHTYNDLMIHAKTREHLSLLNPVKI